VRLATYIARSVFALILATATAAHAAEPVQLPEAFAEQLRAAQKDLNAGRPAEAIRKLQTVPDGAEDHALRHLLLGYAHARQDDLTRAAAEYERALVMDSTMTEAGLALAQVRVRQQRWREAADLFGRHANVDTCEAYVLFLYAQAARAMEDGRLARLLVEKGIARVPSDERFRQMDLALAFDAGDAEHVRRAVRYLLTRSPTDADLWRRLAWARGEAGETAARIAALEAAVLCDPADLPSRRALLAAELAAGNWPTVLARGNELLAGPLAEKAVADTDLMDVLVRAADAGEADNTLQAWLQRVPAPRRTRAMHVAEARLALRQGEAAKAREVLKRLIGMGDADASVFLWAGHLAEQAEAWAEAETYYDHARGLGGRDARLATLYLAWLHIRQGRDAQAARLLRSHLKAHPEDAVARSLLALAEETAPAEAR